MGKVLKKIAQITATVFAFVVATRFVFLVLERINPVSREKYIEVYRDRPVD